MTVGLLVCGFKWCKGTMEVFHPVLILSFTESSRDAMTWGSSSMCFSFFLLVGKSEFMRSSQCEWLCCERPATSDETRETSILFGGCEFHAGLLESGIYWTMHNTLPDGFPAASQGYTYGGNTMFLWSEKAGNRGFCPPQMWCEGVCEMQEGLERPKRLLPTDDV